MINKQINTKLSPFVKLSATLLLCIFPGSGQVWESGIGLGIVHFLLLHDTGKIHASQLSQGKASLFPDVYCVCVIINF